MKSIHAVIAPKWRCRIPVSPYIFHTVHETITPASPQAGAPVQGTCSRGAMSVKAPDGSWASATSSSHLAKNAATSRL